MSGGESKDSVRPTKRCLNDLRLTFEDGRSFPTVDVALSTVDHPLINKAQHLPATAAAGGAEHIKALSDRAWFRVKVTDLRGAATELTPADTAETELLNTGEAWWWLCAAGERREDSATDFYKAIEAEAIRAGAGTGKPKTTHLLPQGIDYARLKAELAFQVTDSLRSVTRRLIYDSLTSGHPRRAEVTGHALTAHVRAQDQEAYLAIVAEGFIDVNLIATILDSVPGVPKEHWQPEPGGALGVTPGFGQIVFSAPIPASAQAEIIELFSDDE